MLGAYKKTPAGTVNNIRPCTLFTYTFAMQTCYCIEPPPSVAVLIRRGLFFVKRQRRYTAYFQKILDIKIVGSTITQQLSNSATQQLSNSATQQLSNSATQQLRRKVCLRPDKRASFFHNHLSFFSLAMFRGMSGNGIVCGRTLGIDRTIGIGCGTHFLTLF